METEKLFNLLSFSLRTSQEQRGRWLVADEDPAVETVFTCASEKGDTENTKRRLTKMKTRWVRRFEPGSRALPRKTTQRT